MTAPDPGLTDLITAHELVSTDTIFHRNGMVQRPECKCGELMQWAGAYPAHLALVVEQHTNGQAAKLAEAVQGMWRLITKLDETSDGLGDWHDATEYIDWARKEVQEIYVRAALEGE